VRAKVDIVWENASKIEKSFEWILLPVTISDGTNILDERRKSQNRLEGRVQNYQLKQSQVHSVHSWLSFLGDGKEDSVRMKAILSVGNVDDSYSHPLGLKCTP